MRQLPTTSELEALVDAEIQVQVGKGATFTAFNITEALRQQNQNLHILNDEVGRFVHIIMNRVVGLNIYDKQLQSYPGGDAWTYFPLQSSSPAGFSQLPPALVDSTPPQKLKWIDGDDDEAE